MADCVNDNKTKMATARGSLSRLARQIGYQNNQLSCQCMSIKMYKANPAYIYKTKPAILIKWCTWSNVAADGSVITRGFWPGVAGVTNTITDGPKTCYDGLSVVDFPHPELHTWPPWCHFHISFCFLIYRHVSWFMSTFRISLCNKDTYL